MLSALTWGATAPDETVTFPVTDLNGFVRDDSGQYWTPYATYKRFVGNEYDTEVVSVEFQRGLPKEFHDWVKKQHGFDIPSMNTDNHSAVPEKLRRRVRRQWNFKASTYAIRSKVENVLVTEMLLAEWRPGTNKDLLREMQSQAVEFALQNYSRRGWDETFADKLRASAKDNWDRSTYVTVRKHTEGKVLGEVVGTLRLISTGPDPRLRYRESYPTLPDITQAHGADWSLRLPTGMADPLYGWLSRHLPAEEVFEVTVPRPAMKLTEPVPADRALDGSGVTHLFGEAIEPGNFAVKKGVSPEVFQEIVVQLLSATFENGNTAEYNEHGKVFYTYGDRVGRALYEPLGFQVVDGVPPMERFGTKWWLLRATPSDTRHFVEKTEARHAWTETDMNRVREAMTRLSVPQLGHATTPTAAEKPVPFGRAAVKDPDIEIIPILPR